MTKSELFSDLEEISFAQKDPDAITQQVISRYELAAGRTLAPGDPVRVFLDSIILVLIQQRNIIDIAAKNNLLAYASGAFLDHIGAMLGVSRLAATPAQVSLRFELSEARNFPVLIPAGTKATTDGKLYFATDYDAEIKAGEKFIFVAASCTTPGTAGNGYAAGQISRLVDIFPYEVSISNVTDTRGGTDPENDENYRERIQIAPESFTTAGSVNAYKYFAKSAHNDIVDVAVFSSHPGYVDIVPLMAGGELPNDEVLQAVRDTCNAENIRPDTDFVSVYKPSEIDYELEIKYWLDAKNAGSLAALMSRIESAITDWEKWERLELGRDINSSELIRRVMAAGAKRCEVVKPDFKVLKANEIAKCTKRNIIYAGTEEG